MASTIPLFCLLLYLTATSFAKTFTKCELVRELRKQGFPENQMKDLLCLVKAESSFQTHVQSANVDGSFDWGLFQINDHYWCNAEGSPGGDCNVRCKDLLSDDITASASCAKIILARQGFSAWSGWLNKCKGKHLPKLGC